MIENYIYDSASASFTASDVASGYYAKVLSVNKGDSINVLFSVTLSVPSTSLRYKRLFFVSGETPNLFDLDSESGAFTAKIIDDGTNYVLYIKMQNQDNNIKIKIMQCDTPHLIKFYPRDAIVALPGAGDITDIVPVSKTASYFTIATLISMSTGWTKTYPTSLLITNENEISGYFYAKEGAGSSGHADGIQIATLPIPLYINTEALFITFTAQYLATDGYWYGCTVRLGNDGSLKVYGIGANSTANAEIRCNMNYRCSKSIINQFY